MAIKSVTSATLEQFVSEQKALGAEIATPGDVATIEAKGEAKSPVIAAEAETVSTAPDPGPQAERSQSVTSEDEAPKQNSAWAKMRAEMRELEQFAREEFDKRVALQTQVENAPKAVTQPQADKRPDRTTYTDAQKYEDDLLGWSQRQAVAQFRAEQERARQQENLARVAEAARKEYADYDEVIQRASRRANVPIHIQAAIVDSPVGGHLAYNLAKDPKLEAEILSLPPAAALLRLGEIQTRFLKKTESPEAPAPVKSAHLPPTTKAPEPMPSITAGAGDVPIDLSSAKDFAQYKLKRMEQIRKEKASGRRYRG